ncbi:MAG TPA: hypothetical protein VIX59_09550 [Candidatus Binataceae bacterium]
MTSDKPDARRKLKDSLFNLVKAGAGSVLLATSFLGALPADASITPANTDTSIENRVDRVRSQYAPGAKQDQARDSNLQLAWWGNWHNGGWRWGWPNWHNWHNWRNW